MVSVIFFVALASCLFFLRLLLLLLLLTLPSFLFCSVKVWVLEGLE